MEVLKLIFTNDFLLYALIVGTLAALCAALLGTSLVLRRFSMIGDGLSHVAFGAVSLAAVLNTQPVYVALPIVIVAAFLLLHTTEKNTSSGDSSIAVISTSALAIGVLIVSLSGSGVDLTGYLFGSILSISRTDVPWACALCAAVGILFILFYNRIFAVTFDESFAKATGIRTGVYNMLIAVLTAVTVVLGMRLMGAMLISSFIIFPSLSAMRICKKFKTVIICSCIISVVSMLSGIFISCTVDGAPTGAVTVCVSLAIYIACRIAGALIAKKR